jgi:hypothetical protein
LKIQHLSVEEIASAAEDLSARWDDLTHDEKRGIIQEIVERVMVGKDEIEITLTCLPRTTPPSPSASPPKIMATGARTPSCTLIAARHGGSETRIHLSQWGQSGLLARCI